MARSKQNAVEDLLGLAPSAPAPSQAPVVQGRDAILVMEIHLPGFAPQTAEFRIQDIVGHTLGEERSPSGFLQTLNTLLRGKFPTIV